MNSLSKLAFKIADSFGLEIHMKGIRSFRQDLGEVLLNCKKNGLAPNTVIDVGAASGTFSLYETYAQATHLLIEPLEERRRALESIQTKYNSMVEIVSVLDREGQTTINVHPDLDGSSLLNETQGAYADGTKRTVRCTTIDKLVEKHDLKPPFLIKLDTQGTELRVLDGASKTLKNTELVITEISLFELYEGTPQFSEVIEYTKKRGFVAYDLFGGRTRPLDGAMAQLDMAFVREDSILRAKHAYANFEWFAKHKV